MSISVDEMKSSWLEAVANGEAEGFSRHWMPDILDTLAAQAVELELARKDIDAARCQACGTAKLGEHHPDCEFMVMKRAMLDVAEKVQLLMGRTQRAEASLAQARAQIEDFKWHISHGIYHFGCCHERIDLPHRKDCPIPSDAAEKKL